MKLTANMKRILSALLVFVLVFSAIPFCASAASTGRTADTIFFATDRHEESSKLNSLLKALAYEPGLVVLGGDHVNNTNSGSLASITSEIHTVYPNADTFYTYAAHDPNVSEDSSNPYAFARTGEVYEGDQYYVYGVDQNDMQSSSSAATASANFVNWAASADSDKVIFVMCHMPIHSRRGDNAGGATWMNALNKAGADRDIVFLWGHNHTGESSADTSVYFVNVGGSLTPQGGSKGTINFTYMNAGYIKNGYASQIVVNSDCVDVTRYNTSGSATATYSIERRFATSHTWEVTETVAATCTADGYTVTVCTDCGETKTTVISATGHDYDSVVKDTCTGSFTVYTCAACGDTYSEANPTETTYDKASSLVEGESYVIVASNYALTYGSSAGKTSVSVSNGSITSDVTDAMIWTYENGKLYNDSTGTAKYINLSGSSSRRTITFTTSGATVSYSSSKLKIGSYYLYHSNSSGFSARSSGSTVTLYQVNEAVGSTGSHTYESVTVDATCTTDGSVTYTCTSCGDTYSEVIPATGSHTNEVVTVAATCTEAGSVTTTCTVCGETTVEEIAALGHDYTCVTVDATCGAEGNSTYTCAACADSYIVVIPATGLHVYESVTVAATCTETGSVTYTCACGDTYMELIAALGHDYASVTTAATCTEGGYTTYTCDTCGESYTDGHTDALGHNYSSIITATCTEAGYEVFTCGTCGDSYQGDAVAALGHSYTTSTVAPTCTADGYTTYLCTVCGETHMDDTVAALGHNYKAVTTKPTCMEIGYTTYTCTVCDHSYVGDEVAALGHDYESVVTAPTYTEMGYTTHTCTVCGDVTVDSYVPMLKHTYESVTAEPTCTEAGSITYTCVDCGDTYCEVIPALGHDYKSVTTDPTCTKDGSVVTTCTRCDDKKVEVLPALGHSYETVTVAPTCTENGYTTHTCACGDIQTEVIEALGHDYNAVVTAPTCTTAGYTTYTCATCGDHYIADEVAALGHDYNAVVTAPTCTTAGYTTYTCATCGDCYTADEVAALGHNYNTVVTAPTCTEAGYTTYTCAVCGETHTADAVAALGHDYDAVVTAPTCTEAGYTTYTCAVCGESYVGAQTAALGHSYTTEEVDGYMVYTCACGHSYSEKLTVELTYDKVTAFTSGESYVITVTSGSKYYALSHAGNRISAVQITVSGDQITSEVTEDLLWDYNDGKLSYEANGTIYYLYAQPASGWMSWFTAPTLTVSTSNSTSVSFSSNKLKLGSYYLRYSSSKISLNRSASTATLFKENEK